MVHHLPHDMAISWRNYLISGLPQFSDAPFCRYKQGHDNTSDSACYGLFQDFPIQRRELGKAGSVSDRLTGSVWMAKTKGSCFRREHHHCSKTPFNPYIQKLPSSKLTYLRGGTRKVGDQEGETKPLCVKVGCL